MIDLYFGDNKHTFPSTWSELSPEQYLSLVELINRYLSGEISMFDVQRRWFISIAKLGDINVPERHKERFADNVMTAARQFNFFYRIDYGGKIDELSSNLRQQLRKTPPDEFPGESGELRYARKLDYKYVIDAVWAKNLLPTLEVSGRKLTGWSADVRGGVLWTTISTAQFTVGYDLLNNLSNDPSLRTLALLTAVLYDGDINDEHLIAEIEKLSPDLLQAVVLNFQAFLTLVFSIEHYSILWNSTSEVSKATIEDAIKVPFSDSIYALCTRGYGNVTQIEAMPLLTYLNIQRADLIRNVKELIASGIKVMDVVDQTKLPMDLILKML